MTHFCIYIFSLDFPAIYIYQDCLEFLLAVFNFQSSFIFQYLRCHQLFLDKTSLHGDAISSRFFPNNVSITS